MKKYLAIIMDLKAWDPFEKLLLCTIRAEFNVSESNKVVTAWKKTHQNNENDCFSFVNCCVTVFSVGVKVYEHV